MIDLSAHFPLLVDDEFQLLAQLVGLADAHLLDIGCGAGQMSARMAQEGAAARVVGIEVDEVQLGKNLAASWPSQLEFRRGAAEALDFEDASFDGATFFKSLHHVPIASMDRALSEVHRVLRGGGWAYVSEPVYDGPFNDLMRLFHDEGAVRASARQALDRVVAEGLFLQQRSLRFMSSVSFRDFEDFRRRMMNPSHSSIASDASLVEQVRQAYERHQTPQGAHFIRPMRIDLLKKR